METENQKPSINYGFKKDVIRVGEDYVFGGLLTKIPQEVLQPDGDWTPYLPKKELQNLNAIEPYACVSFTLLNCIETLIKKQYNEDVNYSDRFLACISGTKEGGNSPNTVSEFLRKIGVVPQEVWPFDETITSFTKFYEKVPPKLYELAREFNEKWEFKHEFVPNNSELIRQALQSSPLGISVPAWYERNGKYYRPDGVEDNHFTTMFKKDTVFDSYDSVIKELEPMSHSVIKRFYVRKKLSPLPFWKRWFNYFI